MRVLSFRISTSVVALILCAAGLTSCGQSPTGQESATAAARKPKVTWPKDDVLRSIGRRQELPQPVSPWRQEESRIFADVLQAHPAEVLVIPFEVQDKGFDRIERSLMTEDFASAVTRHYHARVVNPYLVARALGEGERRYEWPDVARLAEAVKARVLIRGYVGHDGHHKLVLTLTVQQRNSVDRPWDPRPTAQRDWTGLPFSDEDLPYRVVHRLQSEMLSLVSLPATEAAALQPSTNDVDQPAPWPLPRQPSDLVAPQTSGPGSGAARLAILAALAPQNPAQTRERLAERGLLLADQSTDKSTDARFIKSYLLHLLYRRPAALAELGDDQSPALAGMRAVLNGNLDSLQTAVAQAQPSPQALLLEFELCYLRLDYGGSCHREALPEAARLARQSRAWESLISSRLTSVVGWEVQSNAEIKSLLDDAFPIQGFSLRDLARAAVVVGDASSETATIDLSVIRHVRKTLAVDDSLAFATADSADRLDYLQLLEGIGESNLLKAVGRVGVMQGLTSEALQLLRAYETVYAGHPAFAELHSSLLRTTLGASPNQPSAAVMQEFEQNSYAAAYLEQGQTAISASVLSAGGEMSPPLQVLADSYAQDFPIRPWWPRLYKATVLDELAYSETELPPYFAEQPFLPKEELRSLLKQRFRGSPNAAEILAHIAGQESRDADPAAAYRAAIQLNPATWSNYLNLGNYLLQNGDVKGSARAYLSYPGFAKVPTASADLVANSDYAYEAGSNLYWRGAIEPARQLYRIAANDADGSYASISSAGRLAMLRGDLVTYLHASFDAAQRYQAPAPYRDYLSMLHAFGMHDEAWAGFGALAERFPQPEVWISALVGQRMAGLSPGQLRQWLLSDNIKHAHFLSRSFSADYAILWNSIDRDPPDDLAQLLDELQGPSKATVNTDGLTTLSPSATQEGAFDYLPLTEFRRAARQRSPAGSPLRAERSMFADAYVDLRAARYADAVRKFDELAAHYPIEMVGERYILPYFAYASAKAGDPLHLEDYLHSARVGGDFAAFLAGAFFEGLHGHSSEALDLLGAAFYNRPLENTDPILSEFRYAEACEWLYNDTHEDAYRQRALEWARMQQRVRPHMAWIYALQARLLPTGPERTQALAMTLYLDPGAKVVQSLSAKQKSDLTGWLDKNNPFTHQRPAGEHARHVAT